METCEVYIYNTSTSTHTQKSVRMSLPVDLVLTAKGLKKVVVTPTQIPPPSPLACPILVHDWYGFGNLKLP